MGYTINVYPDKGYNRVPRIAYPEWIAVHYTADGVPDSHTAWNSMLYFGRANRNASAHYFIDNYDIWQFEDPQFWTCWHVGDGHGAYGILNANSIGIEVVQNVDEPFSAEEIDKLHWLVRLLMARFGIDADHVVRHWDASRKLCPWYYTNGGEGGDAAWWQLHALITSPYEEPEPIEPVDGGVHRLYNPNSGAHHFTADVDEARMLQGVGWHYEGIGWLAGSDGGAPVYRLYNPYSGDHMFTPNAAERDMLRKVGWSYEGVAWHDAPSGSKVWRLFNPYAPVGAHMLTLWESEARDLIEHGWIEEPSGFHGCKPSN